MNEMVSPMVMMEFKSWVLTTVVVLNSWVILVMSSSMSREVLGSRPELGSSKKRYLGLQANARAMAARFFIPPLNSAGYSLFVFTKSTHSRQKLARSRISLSLMSVNMSNGKVTFSSMVMESNSAEPWNTMPISLRSNNFSFSGRLWNSRPL